MSWAEELNLPKGSKYQVSNTGHGFYITLQEAPGDPVTNYNEVKVMYVDQAEEGNP